jgi:protein-S-isoprenylcysteine O-methyltransferase Ste14
MINNHQGVVRIWLIKTFLGVLITAALLFIPAGRLDWGMGWLYVASLAAIGVYTAAAIDPELIAERNQRKHAGQKNWDKAIFGLYGTLISVAVPVLAGLDLRFGWQPIIPDWGLWIGFAGYVLGWGMNLWAMKANKYFSQVVRIQSDRGQRVVDTGPYQYIRHPGYAGGIVMTISTPILLGSVCSFIAGCLGGFLLLVRTMLEDRTLQEELPGYRNYAQRVQNRLLPGIW